MYRAQGIFQHHFQCKKVRTILDKIWCRSSGIYNGLSSITNVVLAEAVAMAVAVATATLLVMVFAIL